MRAKLLLFTIISIAISSCSSGPDLAKAENDYKDSAKQQSEGRIEIVEMKKTNESETEMMGQKVLTAEYDVEFRITEECYMYVNQSGTGPEFESFRTYKEEPEFIPSFSMKVFRFRKGQIANTTTAFRFRKTDKGWESMRIQSLF